MSESKQQAAQGPEENQDGSGKPLTGPSALILALLLAGCDGSDMDQAPKSTSGQRFDVTYHGGPGAKMVYTVKDKKTGCEFVTFQASGEGAAIALIPGTCLSVAKPAASAEQSPSEVSQ